METTLKVTGVKLAAVDLNCGSATVQHDESATRAAMVEAGYQARAE